MKLRHLLTIKSTICLTAGFIFTVAPGLLLTYFGVPNNEPSGLFFMARSYGAILFLLGLILWLGGNLSDRDILRVIVPAIVIGDAVSLIVAVMGQMSRMMNDMGWFVIAFYLVSVLGLGVFLFPKRVSQSQTS